MNGGVMGLVEKAVREDIEALGDLVGVEPSLAEMAYRVAREIDAAQGECETCGETIPSSNSSQLLPALNKELRATLKQLVDGRPAEDGDDDLGDLASPD